MAADEPRVSTQDEHSDDLVFSSSYDGNVLFVYLCPLFFYRSPTPFEMLEAPVSRLGGFFCGPHLKFSLLDVVPKIVFDFLEEFNWGDFHQVCEIPS